MVKSGCFENMILVILLGDGIALSRFRSSVSASACLQFLSVHALARTSSR